MHPERREEADLAPEIFRTDLRDVEHPRRDIVKGNSVLDVIRPVFRNAGALDGWTVFVGIIIAVHPQGVGLPHDGRLRDSELFVAAFVEVVIKDAPGRGVRHDKDIPEMRDPDVGGKTRGEGPVIAAGGGFVGEEHVTVGVVTGRYGESIIVVPGNSVVDVIHRLKSSFGDGECRGAGFLSDDGSAVIDINRDIRCHGLQAGEENSLRHGFHTAGHALVDVDRADIVHADTQRSVGNGSEEQVDRPVVVGNGDDIGVIAGRRVVVDDREFRKQLPVSGCGPERMFDLKRVDIMPAARFPAQVVKFPALAVGDGQIGRRGVEARNGNGNTPAVVLLLCHIIRRFD